MQPHRLISSSHLELIPFPLTDNGIEWIHHTVPEADVLETKIAIEDMLKDLKVGSRNGSVTTKPTIAYGEAAALGQYPYLVSLQ